MFPGCLQDFSRMFSGCSDGSYWPGGIWWSFQMKVRTLKIQRNPMIPNYLMIPAAAIRWSPGIRWSPVIRWSPAILWSIRSMDFDNRKVYGDTSITDGLVLQNIIVMKNWKSWYFCTLFVIWFATPAIFKAMECLFCKKRSFLPEIGAQTLLKICKTSRMRWAIR